MDFSWSAGSQLAWCRWKQTRTSVCNAAGVTVAINGCWVSRSLQLRNTWRRTRHQTWRHLERISKWATFISFVGLWSQVAQKMFAGLASAFRDHPKYTCRKLQSGVLLNVNNWLEHLGIGYLNHTDLSFNTSAGLWNSHLDSILC